MFDHTSYLSSYYCYYSRYQFLHIRTEKPTQIQTLTWFYCHHRFSKVRSWWKCFSRSQLIRHHILDICKCKNIRTYVWQLINKQSYFVQENSSCEFLQAWNRLRLRLWAPLMNRWLGSASVLVHLLEERKLTSHNRLCLPHHSLCDDLRYCGYRWMDMVTWYLGVQSMPRKYPPHITPPAELPI